MHIRFFRRIRILICQKNKRSTSLFITFIEFIHISFISLISNHFNAIYVLQSCFFGKTPHPPFPFPTLSSSSLLFDSICYFTLLYSILYIFLIILFYPIPWCTFNAASSVAWWPPFSCGSLSSPGQNLFYHSLNLVGGKPPIFSAALRTYIETFLPLP